MNQTQSEVREHLIDAIRELARTGELGKLLLEELIRDEVSSRRPRIGDVVQYHPYQGHSNQPTTHAAVVVGVGSSFNGEYSVDLVVFDPNSSGMISQNGGGLAISLDIDGRYQTYRNVPYSADFGVSESRAGSEWWRFVEDEDGNILERLAQILR